MKVKRKPHKEVIPCIQGESWLSLASSIISILFTFKRRELRQKELLDRSMEEERKCIVAQEFKVTLFFLFL